MNDLEFESDDVAATEAFMVRAYTKMRLSSDSQHTHARIARRWLGPVSLDDLEFSYDVSYDSNPLGRICLCRVHSGHIEQNFLGERQDVFARGDTTLLTTPDVPFSGRICNARFDVTMFDPALLDRVAANAPQLQTQKVRLLGHRPATEAAGRYLCDVVAYLRDRVLANPDARASRLITSSAAAHLAASVLNTFPNTALTDPTSTDRNDAKPVLLRRAISFIDENAHADIAIADIANAIHVTPRAVQYMFRRHLGMTPSQFMRQVRLERAHQELLAADPSATTVSTVAARWGFAHSGRFAAAYRQAYGRHPYSTLTT
jgi:AraC-like DNA-binding protein